VVALLLLPAGTREQLPAVDGGMERARTGNLLHLRPHYKYACFSGGCEMPGCRCGHAIGGETTEK